MSGSLAGQQGPLTEKSLKPQGHPGLATGSPGPRVSCLRRGVGTGGTSFPRQARALLRGQTGCPAGFPGPDGLPGAGCLPRTVGDRGFNLGAPSPPGSGICQVAVGGCLGTPRPPPPAGLAPRPVLRPSCRPQEANGDGVRTHSLAGVHSVPFCWGAQHGAPFVLSRALQLRRDPRLPHLPCDLKRLTQADPTQAGRPPGSRDPSSQGHPDLKPLSPLRCGESPPGGHPSPPLRAATTCAAARGRASGPRFASL